MGTVLSIRGEMGGAGGADAALGDDGGCMGTVRPASVGGWETEGIGPAGRDGGAAGGAGMGTVCPVKGAAFG